jgi:uncharacterized membrane protein YsdA (DUF1294 family)
LYLTWPAVLAPITFLFYWFDKHQSRGDGTRIPERVLLLLSLVGGFAGGFLGMLLVRHKTKEHPEFWAADRFEDFLTIRRKLIAEAINERMHDLLVDLEPPKAQTLADMIALGESSVLEFKSSLRWDYQQQQVNTGLQKVIAKTVAGFLNTEGGTLLIGVADNGNVVGIEPDLKTLKQGNQDGFELTLRNVLDYHLGAEFSQYVHTSFAEQEGCTVCIVSMERSPQPVYLMDKNTTEFCIRSGNATKQLDVQGTQSYISMHWEA